jgi:filamentous hemagglutinin family protein
MTYTKKTYYRTLSLVGTLIAIANSIILIENSTYAQIKPDNTLGAERSVVKSNENIRVRGLPANLIEGGAVRGSNLFHSFLEFNIQDKQRVYFANPPQVENIINRVTGNHPSNIQGTVGVLGNANLFLINPNGIIFGQNARLDIKGSFVASTASSLTFPNGSKFSATNPQVPPLLKINVPVGLQYGTIRPQTAISNNGNLVAGRDLTLAAGNLNLQGRLEAGKNLTLQATNTLSVRDSAKVPFIATARENLLVQGDRAVDIYALNNPMSGFFSGDNMVLRSAKTIQADAHFRSRGNFRIEQLDGSLGGLLSLKDPVIRANGDVFLNDYQGTSLHIFAGGSVIIPGEILIQGADPNNGIVENVKLSDGTIASIKGRTQPTLDIRAGTTTVGTPFVNSRTPKNANITIGTIFFEDNDSNPILGTVLLTNQYEPNSGIKDGNIRVNFLVETNGGSVFIDSKGKIEVNEIFAGREGDGGDITLLADRKITVINEGFINSDVCVTDGECSGLEGNIILKSNSDIDIFGKIANSSGSENLDNQQGGSIQIKANSVLIDSSNTIFGAGLFTETYGSVDAGNIIIRARDTVTIKNKPDETTAELRSDTFGTGNAGNLVIIANSVDLNNNIKIFTSVNKGAIGNGGAINLNTRSLSLDNSQISASTLGTGNGGAINLNTRSLSLDNSQISASTAGRGNAGSIKVENANKVDLNNNSLISTSVDEGAIGNGGAINLNTRLLSLNNGAEISASTLGTGNGGAINLNTRSLSLDNSQISASTAGRGNAGSIKVENANRVDLNNNSLISTSVDEGAIGNGGAINLNTRSLSLNNAQISASTLGTGNAGKITINATKKASFDGVFEGDTALPSGVFTSVGTIIDDQTIAGNGQGGDIDITTPQLSLTNQAQISASNIAGTGNGGAINLNTRALSLNNAQISASTSGIGNAGSIKVENANTVDLTNQGKISTSVDTGAIGDGGAINLNTRSLSLNNAQISASTLGRGDAGSIKVENANTVDLTNDSKISTSVNEGAIGNGGAINLDTRSLSLDNAQISASTAGRGNAGNIKIENADSISLNNGTISTGVSADAVGKGGDIILNVQDLLLLRNNSQIAANAERKENGNGGNGNGGDITINAGTIFAVSQENNDIVADAFRGDGGDINISAQGIFNIDERRSKPPNRTNDIDANSEFGVDGTVTLNSPNVDPSRRSIPLPNLTTAPEVLQGCRATTQRTASRFINTGRGGLPPDIEQSNNNTVWEDLRTPTLNAENTSAIEIVDESNSTSPVAIVEAQGLVIGSNGEIILSAQPSKVTPYSNLTAPTDCRIR